MILTPDERTIEAKRLTAVTYALYAAGSFIGYLIGLAPMVVFVGIFVFMAVHLWAIYRVVRGGLNVIDEKAMDAKGSMPA